MVARSTRAGGASKRNGEPFSMLTVFIGRRAVHDSAGNAKPRAAYSDASNLPTLVCQANFHGQWHLDFHEVPLCAVALYGTRT